MWEAIVSHGAHGVGHGLSGNLLLLEVEEGGQDGGHALVQRQVSSCAARVGEWTWVA